MSVVRVQASALEIASYITMQCYSFFEILEIIIKMFTFMQRKVPRYLLFCKEGIYSTRAHTSVGTKLTSYIGKTLMLLKIYFDDFANQYCIEKFQVIIQKGS